MSVLQEEYKLAIDKKMLSPKVSEQDFEKMLKDETKRKEYWDYCHQKNPSFYADDYNRFSQLTTEMLGEANRPSVAEHPAPTTAEEDSISLAKQNEGEQQYNIVTPMIGGQTAQPSSSTAAEPIQVEEKKEEQSALDKGMQIIDDAWDKSGFLGKVFLSPMKLAEVGISLVQGAASGVVEWGGRGAMSLMAQAVENNKAGDYDTFKVDAMGNPMFVPKIGEDGQYEKAGYSIEEQIEAAKRVEQAEAEGKEADIKDKNASMYVRAANKLEKVADRLHKSSMPNDVAEDATFIDLIREGEVMDAVQLSVASTGQSIPYMLLNSLPGGGFIAGTLGQANTYLDLSKEHPEMDKWKRYTYAIGSSGIEQAVEKFTNPFKGLKGASKKEVAKTLKEITDGAEKAIWKRVAGNVLKEAAGEGGEELATSVFTDIFGTMIDTDGEYGIGIIGQYNEYADQMQEQNPTMTNNDILKSFVGNKAKEYAESFIMGALSGAYISTVSSIATRDYAKEEQKKDKIMLDAITATADANGLAKEDVLGIVMKEKDGELTDEENSVATLFKKNYAKATMKSVAEEQGNELVEKIANKSNGYVFEVDFADGSLGETDMAYIVDGTVYTTDVDGKAIIDRTTSDKVVYVKVLKEDGSEEVKQVAVDELNLIGTPMQSSEYALQYQQGIYNTAEQLLDAQEQVVGEDNGQQPLGVTEGEQASNIEGRQFTNGQQTITASNPDSNGNVTLSAPVTLPNGDVVTEMPQAAFEALMEVDGWQEVTPQPTAQGQAQGQQQAPVFWAEMTAEQAIAEAVTRNNGNKQRAKQFAERQIAVKKQALKDAEMVMRNVPADDLDAFNAAQDKVDAAQAEVDKWTAVANGIDAYNAPVPSSGNISATSASGNGVVTEEPAQAPEVQEPASQEPQQPTQGAQDEPKKITRESVRELLSKEAQEMEEAWNHNEEMDKTDATEIAHDIFGVLGDNVHSMMREEIDDYVGEHYPTQATISGETDSEKGKKEREQLKNDKNLKALEDAVKAKQAELDAIVEETRKMIKEICTSPDATAQDIAELLEALAGYESRIFHLHEQSGSMSNYDMLDKYIGTTKAFQKDVKMLYGRKIAMANASAKVKEVIELADKASEVVGDKEKFAGAYKRKEDALNALTLEELEQLKDVLRITGMNDFLYQDAENRVAAIKEEQRRQKQANSLSDIFDNGGTQVERPAKVKPYKYNPFDFATNDPARPAIGTAYHEDGYVVSTDAYVLVAVKQEYDKELEGKMTDKGGKVVLEGSKFPKWKQVFDGVKTNKTDVTAVSVDDFRSFLEGAKATLKAEWQSKKDNGEKVGSFKDYLYNKADVMIRTNGGVHAYRLGRLIDFANALSEIGAKEVFFNGRQEASAQPMVAETSQGKAIIMPVLVDNISIEEGGRVVTGNSNTAFLYDLADKNTRMSANNSQNTLQNGNNSVPLQGEKSATQKVIDKIDSKHFPVVVFNKKNYREVMRKAGASEKLIKEVGDVLSDLKPHQVMGGLFDEGMIFIQEQTDLDAVRKAYVHERQHAFNASNEQLLLKMAATSYKSQFAAMIRAMAGNNFYDKYGMKYLVDEFVCRAMEIAYSVDTDAELEAELRKIGANDKQIQIIKEINNEQRNDNSLSNARYNSLLNSNDSSRSEQVRRDSQSVSRGVLGEKGNGSAQIGERRDRSRRSSETIGEVAKNFTAEQTLSNAGEQVSADGVRYNIASNDKVVAARETQLKRSVRNGLLTANEANEIREFAQAMRVIAETIAQAKKADGSAEFPSFSEWNGLEVQVNANGTPLVSAIKSNGEYPMNIDFAKHCIKRDSTNQVLNKLVQVDPELFTSLTTDMLVEINQIINKHGLSVPCVGCFVEARRFRSAEYAKSVVNTWNTLVDAVKKGDKAVKEAKKKLGGKQSVDKIVEHLRNTPSDDVKISESDIISPNKYGELMMKHPSIPTLLQATQGQNNTHLIVPEAIYYGDVLNLSAENSWDVDAAYEVGGVRLQSFSDFKAKLFFDYCQVLADLASKKLPAHSYTKVPSFAELFGLTGMKINLSLYYSGTGLDANGNYTYSDESISPEFAFDLQSREGYTDNVGTMAIGVSDEHIWKLLKDENIRSISPYHKSGINPEVAAKLKADEFVDYTNEQNAVTPKSAKKEGESWQDYYARITKRVDGKVPTIGKKVKPEFNLYDDLIDTNSPIQTAQNYVAYCQENGIVPKFASFVYNADGSFNEEYYKLLFDFSVYNKDGVYAPQGAVKWAEGSMPTNTVDILKQALEVEEGTIAKNQAEVDEVVKDILANVFDRDDLAASESQVRYSVVTDKKLLNELEGGETIKVYRAMQLQDGKLYPPMSGKVDGEWRNPIELGVWEQADEAPDKAIARKGKDGQVKYVFKLDKGNKKSLYAAYNPYIHTSRTPLNDQFSEAQDRPELVTVEVEIPTSELTSGYKAEKAKDAVGELEWKAGVVQGQLTGTRKVILSRYDKPIRIVPDAEVAERIVEMIDGKDVVFPSNVVTPQLRAELEERGIQFKETDNQGKPRFSVTAAEDKAYADAVARGDMETAQRMVIEAAKKAMPNTKIVDADGNPMIVYHDTNATELVNIETGENWNDLDWRAKDEWRKREDFDEYWEERDFYTFNNKRSRRSIEMPAYFFSTKEDEYHEYGDRTIRAFLNITNPAIDPTIENVGTYDYAGEDAMNRLIEQGHDGFIRTMNNGEWDEVNAFYPNQIKSAETVTYDDNGEIIPLSKRFDMENADIRFSISNNNQRIFISNAEKAVESIKQDKATPQQWKAMIEKQGGLKAGEDKWLGLSEWLDSKVAPAQENETMGEAARRVAKNTITKQEILDYIDEHQIQIEEVEYGEYDMQDVFEGYRREYKQYYDEAVADNAEDPQEDAWQRMIEEHGEDFSMGFYAYGDELQWDTNSDYVKWELENSSESGLLPINDTRMQYTTEGLENKQEIALTVPTVESWNEGDEIHFGDAGDGRAIAWIRFGETEVQIPREVIDHVDELQFAYTNANGQDVYAPQGSKFSKDYAVYGKLANGEMGYVLYVRNNQLSAHPTLEAALDALNAHYEANPRQVTDYGKVLVIDEIQSKRHQEGREKGYATKKDRDIKKKIAKLTDQQDAIFDTMRAREEGRAGITNFTEEETAELKRLGEEIKQLQSELSADNGIIPDAPFDKNWHELAFKRMLRFAAENDFDYVAWTKGEQQAERYDIGKQFDSIEREDNPSINGRRFALNGANYFTFVVNEEGVITESDMSEIQGKPLADVVGKDLAIRMMSLEDGDAIEGADLRIGGEGMKGFYDKILPSFVSKYTKKWGAKVQDINLPSLEESAQTMHAVNVTQEMKDSVMEGQVMFSVRNTAEDLRMSEENATFAEQYRFGEKLLDSDYIDPFLYEGELDAFNEAQEVISKVTNDTPLNQVIDAYNAKAKVIEQFIDKVHSVTTPVHVVASIHTMMQDLRKAGISGKIAREIYNERIEERKYGIGALGFVYDGHVYIMAEHLPSLSKAQLVYGHELQHVENSNNEQLLIDVIRVAEPKELLGIAESLGGEGYADNLDDGAKGYITLADEAIAFAIEYGYMLGNNGNLAAALKRDGLKNEKLINLLQREYERRKENTNLALNKIKRNESDLRSDGVGVQQDARTQEGKSRQVFEWKGFVDSSDPRSQLGKSEVEALRREAISELESRKDVPVLMLERVRFSVTGAPVPAPNETKSEYLKRYMAWRESQVDANARREFVQEMKKADEFFAKAAKKIVDRNKPIDDFQKAVVAQGGKLNVGNNAYADTTMAIGRAGYQVRRFADHQLKNMLDAIREMMDSKLLDNIVLTWDNMDSEYTDPKNPINGKRLTVRELIGVYCQAMDVKEAKEKGLPDRGEAGFKKNLRDANGNEVSYEDVIRMVHDAVAGTNLTKKLWRSINDATKFALRYQLAAGMIDQETFDKYDRDYYVPERGWRERDLDGREDKYNESQGMTNGSPYNAALQKAKGRDSLASDPFAYIQSIAETSILSAEKNKVKQKFLQFVFDNEAIGRKTGAWNIRKVWLVEGADGLPEVSFEKPADESKIINGYATESQIKLASEVRQRTRAERLQHQVIVMRDGVQYIVELESEELANTLNGKYEGMNDLWEGWGNVQRSMVNYMSAINTQYNPVFPVFNFIRDFQLAMISNIGEQDAKFAAKFMKNIGKVQGAIWKYVANEKIMGREAFLATPMGKYLEEYFEQGAQTGFSFLRDIEALNKDIDKALTEGKFKRGAKKTKDVVLGTLSMMTEASELTVRLAQYVTARESGYSAEEAAQMAKEISVNFDRKGTESRALSKLYSFFNASIQGTNKIWRMLKHSRKANAVFWGSAALYMALGILNTLMNPDDPEEDVWASDYTRKTNFILFGKYRIPVAHLFRIFYGAGVEIVLAAQGRKTRDKAIFDTVTFTLDELVPSSLFQVHNFAEFNEMMNEVEFNPAQYVQGAAPSWISPLTDVAINRNFMGGKINKEPYTTSEEGKYKAGKYAMKNTDEFWIDMADLLSGGDSRAVRDYEEREGVSGSTLQHIFEGYVGQAGKFVLDAGALPIKAAKGEEITTKDIPYVNRLIIPYKQESAYNQEYWTLKKDLQHYEFLLDKKKKEDREAYWEERESEQYAAYIRLKRLVNRKPKEGDTHTPEDVRKLMEANKEWRRLK